MSRRPRPRGRPRSRAHEEIAHESEDEVAVLLELEAPVALTDATRPHASLEVVLGRSGSMSGPPLEGAKQALVALVRRLEPSDNFGLVTVVDGSAQVVVPAGPLTDKDAVVRRNRGRRLRRFDRPVRGVVTWSPAGACSARPSRG